MQALRGVAFSIVADRITGVGLARTFRNARGLSVLYNLLLYGSRRAAVLRLPAVRRREAASAVGAEEVS
jgi:hypothetical protein